MGFVNFHGMLCYPSTAKKCMDAFDGTILFMPSDYTPNTLSEFDCSAKGVLTPLTYYLLVLGSLTGLSTALGMTNFIMAKEFPPAAASEEVKSTVGSKINSALRVEPFVLEYCKNHTESNAMYLKRHFEYDFKLVGLHVIMLHFLCDQDKLHLVEVYQFNNRILRSYVAPFCMSVTRTFRDLLVPRQQRQKEE